MYTFCWWHSKHKRMHIHVGVLAPPVIAIGLPIPYLSISFSILRACFRLFLYLPLSISLSFVLFLRLTSFFVKSLMYFILHLFFRGLRFPGNFWNFPSFVQSVPASCTSKHLGHIHFCTVDFWLCFSLRPSLCLCFCSCFYLDLHPCIDKFLILRLRLSLYMKVNLYLYFMCFCICFYININIRIYMRFGHEILQKLLLPLHQSHHVRFCDW